MVEAPYIIGIAGPSCSGKTTLAQFLTSALGGLVVALDSYYLDLSGIPIEERDRRNFDAPEALDLDLMIPQLTELAGGGAIDKPVYRFATHTRAEETVRVSSFADAGVLTGTGDTTCVSKPGARVSSRQAGSPSFDVPPAQVEHVGGRLRAVRLLAHHAPRSAGFT